MEHFNQVKDPRVGPVHLLLDIIVITICAVLGGADDWGSIVEFGDAKKGWFGTFLPLSHGIPSEDTFRRVFTVLDPKEFARGFVSWVHGLAHTFSGVIAIDGKALRRAHETGKSGQESIRMVSAWSAQNRLILGQEKVTEKSNEITAIPKLLQVLNLHDAIVTIDAMGCQEEIAEKIVHGGGNYVLSLKGNQGNTLDAVVYAFAQSKHDTYRDICDQIETHDVGHGRIETRIYRTITDVEVVREWSQKAWRSLRSIGMVESTREDKRTGEKTMEVRYYLSSLRGNAKEFGTAVRDHWSIENRLHWSLDMAFREDESRMRMGNSAENFALIRRLALSLLKKETTLKLGIKNKRLAAGWDEQYLLKLLALG